MKKIIALLLTCFVCVACFSIFASADDYDVAASLLPDPNGDMTVEGCTVTENADGSVTITVTEGSTHKVTMLYKDGETVLDEKYSTVANYHFAYWYEITGNAKFDARAYYQRKDKVADLYISGMQNNDKYLVKGTKDSNFGVWSIYDYLTKEKGADFVTGDFAVLKFDKIEYEIKDCKVGDTVTIYYHGTMKKDEIPEDFGTKAAETPSEDPSEAPSEAASEPTSEESSEASTATSTPAESSTATTSSEKPAPTSDSGIAALAVISVLAAAGVVVVKKSR